MDTIGLKRITVLIAVLVLFHFYYTYFRISLDLQRRLEPWKDALRKLR